MNKNKLTLDELGVAVIPRSENTVDYRMRDVVKYAKDKGINTEDLTSDELEMFTEGNCMINFNKEQISFLQENVYKQLDITEVNKENAEAVLDFLFDKFEAKYSSEIVSDENDTEARMNLAFLDTITNELMRVLNIL